jgi:hypothetical protein
MFQGDNTHSTLPTDMLASLVFGLAALHIPPQTCSEVETGYKAQCCGAAADARMGFGTGTCRTGAIASLFADAPTDVDLSGVTT